MSTLREELQKLQGQIIAFRDEYGFVLDATPTLTPLIAAAAEQEKELAALRSVCAEAYQMAGVYGASAVALDNLSAAANGKPIPHETFLPVHDQHSAAREALERVKAAARLEGRIIEAKRQPHEDTYEGSCGVHMPRFCGTCRRIAELTAAAKKIT